MSDRAKAEWTGSMDTQLLRNSVDPEVTLGDVVREKLNEAEAAGSKEGSSSEASTPPSSPSVGQRDKNVRAMSVQLAQHIASQVDGGIFQAAGVGGGPEINLLPGADTIIDWHCKQAEA